MNEIINLAPVIFDEEEKWSIKNPKYADHIKTPRAGGIYTHHGIYVSNKEVIHFASEDSDNLLGTTNEIISTNLNTFLRGGELFVREYTAEEKCELRTNDQIVKYARACKGDDGYNLAFNNCEHFTNMCTFAEHRSTQVEKVLLPIQKENSMFSLLGGLFGGKDKDKNITTTTYEPDKVRVAEIENQTKLMLKKLEAENIKLNSDMQKELVSHMIEEEKSLIQAKAEGYSYLLKEIAQFSNNLIELRIEKNNELQSQQSKSEKEIISYYNDFSKSLEESNRDFELNHLPKLTEMRDKYQKDSASYETYTKMIDERLRLHLQKMSDETAFFREQRVKRLESSRDIHKILERHLNEMNTKMIEIANEKSNLLELQDNERTLLEQTKINLIEDKNVEKNLEVKDIKEIENGDMEIVNG